MGVVCLTGSGGACWLYVVGSDRALKVGIASNLDKRLRAIKTYCPDSVELVGAVKLGMRKSAQLLEHEVHAELRRRGMWRRGEWFRPERGEIRRAIRLAHWKHARTDNFMGRIHEVIGADEDEPVVEPVMAYHDAPPDDLLQGFDLYADFK